MVDLSARILDERLRLLYANAPQALLGNLIAALVVVVILWQDEPRAALAAWLGTACVVLAARTALLWWAGGAGRRAPPSLAWTYTLGAMASGAVWGAAGVLFFGDKAVEIVTLVIILAGLLSAAQVSHSPFFPAYVGFAIPTVAPFAVRCMVEGSVFFIGVGIASLMYLAVNIAYSYNHQRTLLRSLRLHFENASLVDELRRQKEIAEQASTAKSKFLAAASHDLRQPAHALGLFVDALAHELATDTSRRLLANIQSASRALGDLLEALLDFSKIDAGAIQPQPRDFPLHQLFGRLETEFAPQAEAKDLRFRVAGGAQWVRSDPALLKRLLDNLVGNAIKYTREGGVLIGCRRGKRPRIEVWDTGRGIPADQQEAIFREFYQLDNPERDRSKGLGLGLAIVDGLARLLGHTVRVRSVPGRGTVFSIELPAGDPGADSAPAGEPIMLDRLAGVRVLIIDDEPAVREGMAALLGQWGCQVMGAECADDSLERAARDGWRPDAILVDNRLRHGESGNDVLRQLAERHGWTAPAAIVTGDTAPERLRDARSLGRLILHKPVGGMQLRAALSTLLLDAPAAAVPGAAH